MPAITVTSVNTGTDELTAVAHGLTTGDRFRLRNVGGALPAATPSLAGVTDYFAIATGPDTLKISDTNAHALAGTNIVDITGSGSGTTTVEYGLPYCIPTVVAGIGGQIKSANDNAAWAALVAMYDLLSGQVQSIFNGLSVAGQAVFKARQILTASSGTYTPTAGAKKCLLRWCGGGGAGGAATNNTAAGCGGGSGESCEIWIDPGGLLTGGAFTNGAAGAGGAGNGGNGGDTTIVINGTTYTAKGGLGGAAVTASAAPAVAAGGASQTTGTYPQCTGEQGGPSIIANNTGSAYSGNGGSSLFGAGGAGRATAGAGNSGTGKGSGGGGAMTTTATTSNGGSGTIGVIVIDEYF